MPNPRYVDEMAEQHGTTQDLPVLMHPHTVTVPALPWQEDPWAEVEGNHANLLYGWVIGDYTWEHDACAVCRKPATQGYGVTALCSPCQRSQARAERSAAERDASMGVAKLVTPR